MIEKNSLPEHSFLSDSEARTIAWAQGLCNHLPTRGWIGLIGALGSGKTVLARALIRSICGYQGAIPSPSYTLLHHYEGNGQQIIHVDFFRLTHPSQAHDLALEEMVETALILIEWPEKGHMSVRSCGTILIQEEAHLRKLTWSANKPA